MTANEWSDEALALVEEAVTAAQGRNVARILDLQARILAHRQALVPDVPREVRTALSAAMDGLHTAVVNNVVADWNSLRGVLEQSAAAIGAITAQNQKQARLLALQPVIQASTSLTAIIADPIRRNRRQQPIGDSEKVGASHKRRPDLSNLVILCETGTDCA
jgi:hypothetical protein